MPTSRMKFATTVWEMMYGLIAVENWKNTQIIMSILFLVDKHHIVLYRKENLVY